MTTDQHNRNTHQAHHQRVRPHIGERDLTIEEVVAVSEGASIELNSSVDFMQKINRGAEFIESLLAEEGLIYGVTTGYGDSCTVAVPLALTEELSHHLFRFHGCGMGEQFSKAEGRAILATRLTSLARGFSGVRYELLTRLAELINGDIVPIIPQEGSVGASGDLTPLSYIAAVLAGERNVYDNGEIRPAAQALADRGIAPLRLKPKEGLAIMNGTAVMTALACLAFKRAEYLAKLTTRITAMVNTAIKGNCYHFDEMLFTVKPHPGQMKVAERLRTDLTGSTAPNHSSRLQDRYSLRCAPHVIGVLEDSLPWLRQFIETELNSANDNPIIDAENRRVLHGGHFYGGHIAFAMDSLKNLVANLADLMDRQLALLVDAKFNNGLPANLSGCTGERAAINHGFKAVQIGVSSWTAEALKGTLPASIFSRSTECHNQDKVSMGTIAARDCLRVLTLTEQVAAASLLAATQGIWLRLRANEIDSAALPIELKQTLAAISEEFEPLIEDRALESTLRLFVNNIQARRWALYETNRALE